jgi:hypothetical protein
MPSRRSRSSVAARTVIEPLMASSLAETMARA